jgi:hypothetical protein
MLALFQCSSIAMIFIVMSCAGRSAQRRAPWPSPATPGQVLGRERVAKAPRRADY